MIPVWQVAKVRLPFGLHSLATHKNRAIEEAVPVDCSTLVRESTPFLGKFKNLCCHVTMTLYEFLLLEILYELLEGSMSSYKIKKKSWHWYQRQIKQTELE